MIPLLKSWNFKSVKIVLFVGIVKTINFVETFKIVNIVKSLTFFIASYKVCQHIWYFALNGLLLWELGVSCQGGVRIKDTILVEVLKFIHASAKHIKSIDFFG